MNGKNKFTADQFLGQLLQDRKRELASLILGGKSYEEIEEVGYGKIQAQEMVTIIRGEVIDCQEFEIESVIETGLEESEDGSDEEVVETGNDELIGTEDTPVIEKTSEELAADLLNSETSEEIVEGGIEEVKTEA